MTTPRPSSMRHGDRECISLCEALDRVLNKGVAAFGEVILSVADVDLIYLSLQLILSSVETARGAPNATPCSKKSGGCGDGDDLEGEERMAPGSPEEGVRSLQPRRRPPAQAQPRQSNRVQISEKGENVKNGLGQLVLTVVKLLHELLERQAIRRIDGGSLNDEEIERLGLALMRQGQEIDRLRQEFGLEEDDLNLDLGPLGRLL